MSDAIVDETHPKVSFYTQSQLLPAELAVSRGHSVALDRANPTAAPTLPKAPSSPLGGLWKRAFDLTAASLLLLLCLPIFLVITVAIRLAGGTAFYSHPRIGHGGRVFGCLKFRSMVPNAAERLAAYLAANPEAAAQWAERQKLDPDPRVTRIGAILRSTSLDELPQLINVIRGDMSLVGPRPVTMHELKTHYGHDGTAVYVWVRPGITGLWQVSGRSDTTYAERVSLDKAYADAVSLRKDLIILLRTVPAVLARRGAV